MKQETKFAILTILALICAISVVTGHYWQIEWLDRSRLYRTI